MVMELAGCKWITRASSPYFSMTNFKVPDGTPVFQKGFKDGCSTVLYSRGNVLYRNRYGYKYDPKLIGNSEYRFGHQRGYTWCFQHSLAATSGPVGSWDRIIQPYGYDRTFDARSVEAAYGGMLSETESAAPLSMTPGTFGGNLNDATFGVWGGTGSGGFLTTGGGGVFTANPLWAGGSKGQIFGQ